jgi:hypothetical protein
MNSTKISAEHIRQRIGTDRCKSACRRPCGRSCWFKDDAGNYEVANRTADMRLSDADVFRIMAQLNPSLLTALKRCRWSEIERNRMGDF